MTRVLPSQAVAVTKPTAEALTPVGKSWLSNTLREAHAHSEKRKLISSAARKTGKPPPWRAKRATEVVRPPAKERVADVFRFRSMRGRRRKAPAEAPRLAVRMRMGVVSIP